MTIDTDTTTPELVADEAPDAIDAIVAAAFANAGPHDLPCVPVTQPDGTEIDQVTGLEVTTVTPTPEVDPFAILDVIVENGGLRPLALADVVAITEGRTIPSPTYAKTKTGPKTIKGAVIHVTRNAGPKAADGTQPTKVNPVQTAESVESVRDKAAAKGRSDIPDKLPAGARTKAPKGDRAPNANMGTPNAEVEAFVAKAVKAGGATVPSLIADAAAAGLSVSRNRLAKIAVAAGVQLGQRTSTGSDNDSVSKVVAKAFAGDAKLTVKGLQTIAAQAGLSVSRNRLVGLADKAGFRFVKAERTVAAKPVEVAATPPVEAPAETPAPKATKTAAKPKAATTAKPKATTAKAPPAKPKATATKAKTTKPAATTATTKEA